MYQPYKKSFHLLTMDPMDQPNLQVNLLLASFLTLKTFLLYKEKTQKWISLKK